MAILALATGLAGELTFSFSATPDGFPIGHLRCTNVGFHFELAQHPIHENLKV